MTETELTSDPQVPGGVIEVCVSCGWPPALDGRCLCFYPEQREWYGRYFAYMTEHLSRLRALKGLGPSPEEN